MHSSLAVTLDGLPLGPTAIKFWSRDASYGCNQMKKSINPTRLPMEQKESYRLLEHVRQSMALLDQPHRCVHIGDRESNSDRLFCTGQAIGSHLLLRTCEDRLRGDGKHTIATEMEEVRVQGLHRVRVRDRKANPSEVVLEIRYRRIRVLPPVNNSKRYPELLLTVIHAQESGANPAPIPFLTISPSLPESAAISHAPLTPLQATWSYAEAYPASQTSTSATASPHKMRVIERIGARLRLAAGAEQWPPAQSGIFHFATAVASAPCLSVSRSKARFWSV
jgi:hypothetical protein